MPRARKPKKPVESPRLPTTFDAAALARLLKTHSRATGLGSWTRESVVAAREAQARGQFRTAVQLGRAILSSPSIFRPWLNRLAPLMGLPRDVTTHAPLVGSAAAILTEARATFAADSVALPPGFLLAVDAELAVHELSIGQIQWETRADGSREDAFVSLFDLDAVEWVENERKLYAQTTDGRVEIVHGDGRWIVFQRFDDRPWTKAAIIPLATLWSDDMFGRSDRSQNAASHGDDKWIGMLPEGVPIGSDDGTAMLDQLEKLYESRRVMIAPFGSKVERNEAMGQNWQIFKELLGGNGVDAAGILVGQDATTTNTGGNYIKSLFMFGVRNDIVESDLHTIGGCLQTGLLRPWSLRNFGRWDRLEYVWLMPDADADQRVESIATRRKAFWEDLAAARAGGAVVDQAYANAVASAYGIEAPRLAPPAAPPAAAEAYPASSTIGRKSSNQPTSSSTTATAAGTRTATAA